MKEHFILLLVLTLLCFVYVHCQWDPPAICMQPVEQGHCMAFYESFFFNRTSGKCEKFVYGGCGGNDNRFHTKLECVRKCSCHMPPDAGPCRGSLQRWHYNPQKGCCHKFTYGGCQGNSNNFGNFDVCEAWCRAASSGRKKPWGTNWGSVNALKSGLTWRGFPGLKWGGGKNIWLHNENIATRSNDGKGGQMFRIISKAGKSQVPGVQTQTNWRKILSSGVTGGSNVRPGGTRAGKFVLKGTVPIGQTGGAFSQIRRVQSAGSPISRIGSTLRRTVQGSQLNPASVVRTGGLVTGGVSRSGSMGTVPIGQTGGAFSQIRRVQSAGSPISRMGSTLRRTVQGSQLNPASVVRTGGLVTGGVSRSGSMGIPGGGVVRRGGIVTKGVSRSGSMGTPGGGVVGRGGITGSVLKRQSMGTPVGGGDASIRMLSNRMTSGGSQGASPFSGRSGSSMNMLSRAKTGNMGGWGGARSGMSTNQLFDRNRLMGRQG